MNLTGQAAIRYFSRPDPRRAGLLIFGADAMRVALRREEVVAALIGPAGEAEMRLTRIPAAELRRDGAALGDAMRAQGFFPGPRAVLVEDATETAAPAIAAAIADWREGDGAVIVTAGALKKTGALRKLFEGHPNAYAAGVYDDPPSAEEVAAIVKAAGLAEPDRMAMTEIMTLSRALDPGDFRQTVEKIALYKWRDPAPLTGAEIALCAPATIEAGTDDLLDLVAEGRDRDIGPMLVRLAGQGVQPVAICIAALRQFRALHAAATHPDGPEAGVARLRPPPVGPNRARIIAAAKAWRREALETAISMLVDTDLTLRSVARAPAMAVMERTLIRLARLRGR